MIVGLRRHLLQIEVVQQLAMDSNLQVQVNAEVQPGCFLRFDWDQRTSNWQS
jgi:hypothetical protein